MRKNYYIPAPVSADEKGNVPILIEETLGDDPGNGSKIKDGNKRIENNDKVDKSELFGDGHERVLNTDDWVDVEIGSKIDKQLLKNLCVPSTSHTYSVAVEFFKNWILSKFDKTYFKTVYIDGKHLFDEFANINERELIKRGKPAIAIIPNIDIDYNREGIDISLHDLNYYARTFNYRDTFFKDLTNDLYLGVSFDQLLFQFQIKIKVNTKAKQLDLVRYLKMAYKIGATSGYYTDMDVHVPYDMLFDLAEKVGFEVDYDNKLIKEPFKFLAYLNRHSEVPFIYKLRNMNSKCEFFLRASNMYVHLRVPDINIDDGERQNQVSSNYYIEFSAEMRFPAPKIFCYFTMHQSEFLRFNLEGESRTYMVNFSNIPATNEKAWDQFINVPYEEEDKSKPLTINFKEIFEKDINIMRVISACNKAYISPSVFLDFKIFNHGEEYLYDIDWTNMSLTTRRPVEHTLSNFVVYVNKEFFNDSITTMDNAMKQRIKATTVTNNNSGIDPFER